MLGIVLLNLMTGFVSVLHLKLVVCCSEPSFSLLGSHNHLQCDYWAALCFHSNFEDLWEINTSHGIFMMLCIIAAVHNIVLSRGCLSILLHSFSKDLRNQHFCRYCPCAYVTVVFRRVSYTVLPYLFLLWFNAYWCIGGVDRLWFLSWFYFGASHSKCYCKH